MTAVRLAIEPDLCGPVSVGTVAVIKALSVHLGLELAVAEAAVSRCAFEAEPVVLRAPSQAAAQALLDTLAALPIAPRVRATLEVSRDDDRTAVRGSFSE